MQQREVPILYKGSIRSSARKPNHPYPQINKAFFNYMATDLFSWFLYIWGRGGSPTLTHYKIHPIRISISCLLRCIVTFYKFSYPSIVFLSVVMNSKFYVCIKMLILLNFTKYSSDWFSSKSMRVHLALPVLNYYWWRGQNKVKIGVDHPKTHWPQGTGLMIPCRTPNDKLKVTARSWRQKHSKTSRHHYLREHIKVTFNPDNWLWHSYEWYGLGVYLH